VLTNLFQRLWFDVIVIAIVILPTGDNYAAERRDLPLPEALVGHWQTHSKATDYYFGDGNDLVMVDNGNRTEMTYRVLETNEENHYLRVSLNVKGSKGHETTLRFANNRLGLFNVVEPMEKVVINTIWLYVDDAKAPPK
jgi:hypothetical protein